MKKLVKKAFLLGINLFFLFTSGCSGKKASSVYTIGIVQITEDPKLDVARNSVIQALGDEGFIEGKNIRIEYQNAQGEIPNISLIIKNFLSKKVDMIITNSTPCMVAAAQMVKGIPVVFTVAFSPEQVGIKEVPLNLYGAYDPYEMDDFVQLIRSSLPQVKKIGILCNSAEPNARFGANMLKQACARQNVELIEVPVFSTNEVFQAAQALAQKQVDAFAIAADNTVYLAMDAMVKVAQAQKIPLFITEPSQIDRGACAGLGIDFKEWGRESGKIAAAVIAGKVPIENPIKALRHKSLYLNLKAAAAQGISFPADLIAKADRIIK